MILPMRVAVILLVLLVALPLVLLVVAYSLRADARARASGNPGEVAVFFRAMPEAVETYREMYQRWPVLPRGDGTEIRPTVAMLRAKDKNHNPLRRDFLEGLDKPVWNSRFDPWGNPYRMRLDMDGDGLVTVGTNRLDHTMVFWSVGPDGVDDFGSGDDLASWLNTMEDE